MPDRTWKRRDFLIGGALLGGVGCSLFGWSLFSCSLFERVGEARFESLLLRTIKELKISPHVGEVFLSSPVGEALDRDFESLAEVLKRRLSPSFPLSQEKLISTMAQAIQQDFARGNICHVQNWYLSLTECQLAAAKFIVEKEQESLKKLGPAVGSLTLGFLGSIHDWGPRATKVRSNPLEQGTVSFWFKTDAETDDLRVYLGGEKLETEIAPGRVTARLKPEAPILGNPGSHDVYLVSFLKRKRQAVGRFWVKEPFSPHQLEEVFLRKLTGWGPRSTKKGQPFNLQPSGSAAFWIRAEGEQYDLVVFLGNQRLRTRVGPELITGASAPAKIRNMIDHPGTYPLYLVSLRRNVRQTVGYFEVR